jgi:hypothetical protein
LGGIADAFPALELLALLDCHSLQSLNGLEAITNLRKLKIGNCRSVTSLSPVLEVKKLQKLYLGDMRNVREVTVNGEDALTAKLAELAWAQDLCTEEEAGDPEVVRSKCDESLFVEAIQAIFEPIIPDVKVARIPQKTAVPKHRTGPVPRI